ncbi:type VI secretion system Vgr family protein [Xanthomonas translucens]|uniref:type VI secretion system Vgr family protein n=2 Tax=Xanthomonas campestris pv. translucens TaxID=343 RepID=UPI0019D69106|nr:type VI secretion system Vgr family protein [Xanthomonas translucens]QSQ43041.1 type VI secretion system tip protein VgrG [Xanthomonas translucens pv. translucens]WLA00050.1 type VI secretion system tip protein VgrG [Xanthomonas translucens]
MEALNALMFQAALRSDSGRLYRLQLPGGDVQVVERWSGSERLSEGFVWWVDVLSTQADLPLEAWLGRRATLYTRLADGDESPRTGLIHEAYELGSDGGLARYRVGLVPWTWWLSQGRHSRVFQERTLVQIVEAVFADYAPMASWQWSEEVTGFLAQARPRSDCVQYRESDLDFVQRLLAEEGLGWRLQEADASPGGHQLVVFADSAAQPQDPSSAQGGGLRYHRSDATEAADSVLALGATRRLGSGRLTVLSEDVKTRQARSAQLPLHGGGRQSLRELYEPVGMDAFASAQEADRYAELMAQAQEAQWSPWQGRSTVRTLRAGTWFTLTQAPQQGQAPPAQLLLTRVWHAGINNLPVDVRAAVQAQLGAAPAWPDASAVAARSTWAQAEAVGYGNAFEAVDRQQPWRPVLADGTGARLNPRPTAPGYQSAIVVGADGSTSGSQEVYADALGRIRVRFHFQQDASAPAAQDSTWLRVAQRYAGPGVGSQFLPRIGQEVLVGFLEGDIDRPVVLGALYNGKGEAGVPATPGGASAEADTRLYAQAGDGTPSAQGNLAGGHAPAWHGAGGGTDNHRNATALWGVQSKEWGGAGHSRLVFDDSDQQLRLQLATTQAATQLNLGHLIHQADNYRGSFRGEGFELRTDAWGAVRATSGLWLSSYGRSSGPAGEATQPSALLSQLQTLGKTFSQAAGTHQTVKLAAHEGAKKANQSQLIPDQAPLQALLTSVKTTVPGTAYADAKGAAAERSASPGDGRVPHTGDALLGLAAPAGIGVVAGQGLHWSVGETLTLASGGGSEAAIAGDARLHSGQAIGVLAAAVDGGQTQANSLSLVSGEGELDVQAQSDEVRVQSKEGLKLISANAEVELAAGKTIHLAVAGGASVTIEGGNITVACPGTITVQASKKSFVGPVQQAYPLPQFPRSSCKSCILDAARQGTPGVLV